MQSATFFFRSVALLYTPLLAQFRVDTPDCQESIELAHPMSISKKEKEVQSVKRLRRGVANLTSEAQAVEPAFVNLLRTFNQWTAGIQGGIGLESLHFIAKVLECCIILIRNDANHLSYWNSGKHSLTLHNIEQKHIGTFLNDVIKSKDKNTPFIYLEDNLFQIIIPRH